MDQKRYFIGLSLPSSLAEAVSSLQVANYDQAHMLYPLVPHITILPPSALENVHPMHFLPKVKAAGRGRLPFSVRLTKASMFDKRVLYVAVECDELAGLHAELASMLPVKVRSAVFTGRGFTPHLTIAQAKQRQALPDELIDRLTNKLNKLFPQTFEASSLAAFTWQKPRHYSVETI